MIIVSRRDSGHNRPARDSAVPDLDAIPPGWTLWRPGRRLDLDGTLDAACRELDARGFLVLRPGVSLTGDSPGQQSDGRHLALLCLDDRDRVATLAYLDRNVAASPRAHLVIDTANAPWPTAPSRRWPECVAALDRRIAGLELGVATSLASALVLRSVVTRRRLSPAIECRLVEIGVWRGRFDPVAQGGDGAEPSELVGWRGVAAWCRGDVTAAGVALGRLRRRSDVGGAADARFWWRVLVRLHATRRVRRGPDIAFVNATAPRFRPIALAAGVEAHLARGDLEAASLVLDTQAERADSSPLLRAVVRHLRGRVAALQAPGAPMSAVADDPAIARPGARGLLRFGNGRVLMHWFHVLPKLLETLRDAEDDEAALRGGCRWLTREAGASKAAIVDEPRHRLIAAEGWTPADFRAGRVSPPRGDLAEAGQVREAPVRYGGERIGYVVATGETAEGETLQSATEAMAALMAPALRTRLDAISSSTRARAALLPEILGCSPAMQALRHDIARAAAVPFPVLIEGESGTGKELVARAIHRLSARRDKRFCALNCAALPDDLFEAELFGHARGAFTGAVAMRTGLIEEAHTGSLFLDEVSELSPRAQAKLLRVVQEREVRRVGENASRPVDVRLISATNVPLTTAVDVGRFRADLQYRLAVVRFALPPLRDRIEDVPILAQAFWAEATRTAAKQARLGHDALAQLCRHGWPGNVRELQNVIAALVVMAPERGRVAARHVERAIGDRRDGVVVSLDDARTSFERQAVASALARHAGRRSAAARELGMTRQGLTKALKRLGLETTGKRVGVA